MFTLTFISSVIHFKHLKEQIVGTLVVVAMDTVIVLLVINV
jgi:hypothetical protein